MFSDLDLTMINLISHWSFSLSSTWSPKGEYELFYLSSIWSKKEILNKYIWNLQVTPLRDRERRLTIENESMMRLILSPNHFQRSKANWQWGIWYMKSPHRPCKELKRRPQCNLWNVNSRRRHFTMHKPPKHKTMRQIQIEAAHYRRMQRI